MLKRESAEVCLVSEVRDLIINAVLESIMECGGELKDTHLGSPEVWDDIENRVLDGTLSKKNVSVLVKHLWKMKKS